ncbi:MAG: hypothetical protein ACRC0V_00365 [Fusobacteriaceae bacterium]
MMNTCGNCKIDDCVMKDFSVTTETFCNKHTSFDFKELLSRKREIMGTPIVILKDKIKLESLRKQ